MSRYVVYGAGAIGGAIGALLQKSGVDVTFIARGAHLAALQEKGLRLRSPSGEEVIPVKVVGHPRETCLNDGDVVILAMKTQDTNAAIRDLTGIASSMTPIVCAQNGVENERLALRYFEHVYGCFVYIAGAHLEPGVVDIHTAPCPGVLDIGRVPEGIDDTTRRIARDFEKAGFDSIPRDDIMAWKREKLLLNLTNAIQAISNATFEESAELTMLARAEAEKCLEAAGIEHSNRAEVAARIAEVVKFKTINGRPFPGGSSWQSLQRGGTVNEVEYLNGEVVLMGRLYGVPTPVNTYLHDTVRAMANNKLKPGSIGLDELKAHLVQVTGQQPVHS